MVRALAKAVAEEVVPEVSRLKPEYTADADIMDGWVDVIKAAFQRVVQRFTGGLFEAQATRIARSTVSMAEAATTGEFLRSVNRAVGVDLESIIERNGLQEYIEASVFENVNLITSVKQQYLDRVESIVMNGMRSGLGVTAIGRQLQEQTGVARRRANFIARDQVAKLNNDVAKRRMQQSGIKHFKWLTSKDQRVTGNPSGKYPKAHIKCYDIAKRDIGFGVGVYTLKDGATWAGETRLFPGHAHVGCRCVQVPVFEFELPENK